MNARQTLEIVASLGPIATAVAALVALTVGTITIRQRAWADRREHWWKRAKWALELAMSTDTSRQQVGLNALEYLGRSELTKTDEADLLTAVGLTILSETGSAEGGTK